MKIVESLEETCLLIKDISETIKNIEENRWNAWPVLWYIRC